MLCSVHDAFIALASRNVFVTEPMLVSFDVIHHCSLSGTFVTVDFDLSLLFDSPSTPS